MIAEIMYEKVTSGSGTSFDGFFNLKKKVSIAYLKVKISTFKRKNDIA